MTLGQDISCVAASFSERSSNDGSAQSEKAKVHELVGDGLVASPRTADAIEDFLSSMTFSANFRKETLRLGETGEYLCDCEDCEPSLVPPKLSEPVRENKRQKISSLNSEIFDSDGGLISSLAMPAFSVFERKKQERTLVASEGLLSVWTLTMPRGGDPLIDYGDDDRIIFVKSQPKNTEIASIGRGIVGSSEEEKDRRTVTWVEGHSYYFPSKGGKAVGWVNAHPPLSSEKKLPKNETASSPRTVETRMEGDCSKKTNENNSTGVDAAMAELVIIKLGKKLFQDVNVPTSNDDKGEVWTENLMKVFDSSRANEMLSSEKWLSAEMGAEGEEDNGYQEEKTAKFEYSENPQHEISGILLTEQDRDMVRKEIEMLLCRG